jgi:hypothetical protein
VRKLENGNFDVLLGDGDIAPPAEERPGRGRREERGRDRGRGRGRERDRPPRDFADTPSVGAGEAPRATQATPAAEPTPSQAREAEQPAVAQQSTAAAAKADAAPPRAERTPSAPPAPSSTAATAAARPAAPQQESAAAAATRATAAPPAPVGFRRGSRGRAPAGGPPPLLEGQTAFFPSAPAPPPAKPPMAEDAPAPQGVTVEPPPARAARKVAAKKAEAERFDPAALGLPRGAGEMAAYLGAYRGVGPKSIQTLIESFGPSRVYDALQNRADKVREVLGTARGERLLDAWNTDIAARRASGGAAADEAQLDLTAEAAKPAKKATRRGGRRGGRKTPARK